MLCVVSSVDCALTGRYVTWLPGARVQCWMLLTVYTLPQLAVSAKILCLLMVVVCGAVPSMVRSVRLYSYCSHLYVNVYPNGTVMACSDGNDQPNLTMSTRDTSLDLLIYSPIHDMYICFVRSKLVGKQITRTQAERTPSCLFREEFINGYSRFHLARNKERFIGFNGRGMPMRRSKSRTGMEMQDCYRIMKEAAAFDIGRHNDVRAGETPKWPPPRRRVQPRSKPCHHHRKRHQKRRNCIGT